jgi:hypothetical protein
MNFQNQIFNQNGIGIGAENINMDIEASADLGAPPVGLFNTNSNEMVPIKFADVQVEIHNNFAKVFINYFYQNLFNKPIDTEFIFPKTKEAVFDSLSASLDNGDTIIAEILSQKEGVQKFKEAEIKGDLAILVGIKETTPDLITTKIGNLNSGQSVKITFSYVTKLEIGLDKNYSFKYPNIFIPRYCSKSGNKINLFENEENFDLLEKIEFIQRPDIEQLSKEFSEFDINNIVENQNQNKNQNKFINSFEDFLNKKNTKFFQYNSNNGTLFPWVMSINISTNFKLSNLRYNNYTKNNNNNNQEENLFNIKIKENSKGAILETSLINFYYPKSDVIISFEDEETFKEPKLIISQHPFFRDEYSLYFKYNPKYLSEKKMSAIALVQEEDISDPDLDTDKNIYKNKHKCSGRFLFVIDRSGSMAGSRIETAKNSLEYFLKSLPEFSKFNICSFGSSYELMYPNFIYANDNTINEALITVRKFKADLGGTELNKPFERIMDQLKNEINPNKELKEIIRIFVLTDGSIDNADKFLLSLREKVNFFNENKIDLSISSLGIGSGCSDYLVKGIAENGNGDSEFAINNEDMIEKVIYLLEYSQKKRLKNFKIFFEDNQDANNSLLINSDVGGEYNVAIKSFNKTIEFFSKIEFNEETLKKFEDQNLIISYIDVDNLEEKITIPLKDALINDDDTIFKIWVNNKVDKFYEDNNNIYKQGNSYNLEKENLTKISIKYSCLNRNTSMFMILKEKNVQENLKKKFVSMTNSDIDFFKNNNNPLSDIHLGGYTAPSFPQNLFGGDVLHNKKCFKKIVSNPSPGIFGGGQPKFFFNSPGIFGGGQNNLPQSSQGIFGDGQPNLPINSPGIFGGGQPNLPQSSPGIFGGGQNNLPQSSLFGGQHNLPQSSSDIGLFKQNESLIKSNPKKMFKNNKCETKEKKNSIFENIAEKTSSVFSFFTGKKKEVKKNLNYGREDLNYDKKDLNYEDEDEDELMEIDDKMDNMNYQNKNFEKKGDNQNQNIFNNNNIIKSSTIKLKNKDNYTLEEIEKEILNNQNFNGSWNENNLINIIINNKNWNEILNNFVNKFSNRIKKENENIFIFSLYVLNFIHYEIKDVKIMNKLKLIISKGEKYVKNNSENIDLYSEEVKNIFGF